MLAIGTIVTAKAQIETFTLSNLNQLQSKYNSVLTKLTQDSISIENEIQTLTNKKKELEIKQEKYKQLYGVSSSLIAYEIKKIGKHVHYEFDWVDEGEIGSLHTRRRLIAYEMLLRRRDIKEVENLIQLNKL